MKVAFRNMSGLITVVVQDDCFEKFVLNAVSTTQISPQKPGGPHHQTREINKEA